MEVITLPVNRQTEHSWQEVAGGAGHKHQIKPVLMTPFEPDQKLDKRDGEGEKAVDRMEN